MKNLNRGVEEQEDICSSISLRINKKWARHQCFFHDSDENLMWYFAFTKTKLGNSPQIYINDSTSSYNYSKFSERFRKLYDENGYNPNFEYKKGMGKYMLKIILEYVYDEFPKVNWVMLCASDKPWNKQAIWDLVISTKWITDIILDIRWWNEFAECSLRITSSGQV